MRTKHYVLVGLIVVSILVISYFPWPEKSQTSEEPEEFPLSDEEKISGGGETQKDEVQSIMNEIDSIIGDFDGLADSINEINENEDLSKIFQGD